MHNLTNIGTNFLAYLPLVAVGVILIFVYLIGKAGYEYSKTENIEDEGAKNKLRKSFIRRMVGLAVVVCFLVFSLFFAYGPGKRQRVSDNEKSGWLERTEKLPDEKPLAVIQEEGEKDKDRTGTLQDVASEDAFKKENEQVNEEIDAILNRNKNQ